MHTFSGARVSVQRRELSTNKLSEDEASGHTHKGLQAKDQRRLSNLQTINRALLLSRETLPGNEVPRTVLFQYQTQAQATATPTKV